MTGHVHIIGAGVAGLAAAVALSHLGPRLTVYEAAPRAGGRCRSYHDPHLDCVIDNGNHLLLSGNLNALRYLNAIGANDQLTGPSEAEFPFIDVATGARWALRLGAGLPWWIFNANRRVPGTRAWEYLSAYKLLRAGPNATVAECVGGGSLYRNFWEPLTVAALNTAPAHASAQLLGAVLSETFLKGGDACRPLIARESLAQALIDPAIGTLTKAGAEIRMSARVSGLDMADDRVTAINVDGTNIIINPDDIVILAVPAWIAQTLLPGIEAPPAGEPIVNVHYRLAQAFPDTRIVGVVGGLAQWVFARGDIASVTISDAAEAAEASSEDISRRCWPDVAKALGLNVPEPPSRVVKEKRATFAQTPDAVRLRPKPETRFANLLLAGDWTDTGLPATIDGAIGSGFAAADLVKTRGAAAKAA